MDVAGKYAARKILGDKINAYQNKKVCGDEDPFFELVPGRHGKMKKVKRRIPDYIPAHDAEILAKVRSRAYHLDMSLFEFMGVRFGWSSVIGLIPEVGDVADVAMAILLYRKICDVECEIDSSIKSKMKRNIAIDFVLGLVPFLGDLCDAAYKCNTKNAVLLSKALDQAYGKQLDDINRKRASRELFPNDPDFAPGKLPPVYEEFERRPNPKSSWREWVYGRDHDQDQHSHDLEKRGARY